MSETSDDLARRARELTMTLVGWPSVTGSADEAAFAGRLADFVAQWPYFLKHPEDLVLAPVPRGAHPRQSLLALVRGNGARTVALAGHFDVVPIDDYGDLSALAGEPQALREGLLRRLRAEGGSPLALADLESGEFLPGRGLLDMKSGLAAGLAVLEQFASQETREGNLLLLATPDEEDRSAGMRAVAAMLPDFLREQELDLALAVNLDAICDDADGATGRVIAMGCLGKLLISAFVVGKEAHACYPFAGVNAAYLAAELACEFEAAPELSERTGSELAAPPAALGLKDSKTAYNVTTAGRAWMFWNVLQHRRSAADVFAISETLARRAVARAAARIRERAEAVGAAATGAWSDVRVIRYADLAAAARARTPGFDAAFARQAEAWAADGTLDWPTLSGRLTEWVWTAAGSPGPLIVLGVASMPYPAINWPDEATLLADIIDRARAAIAAETGVSIGTQAYFPAIADMSFLGPVDAAALDLVAANMPVWETGVGALETPGAPIVNIGPWGRDYHHWLERLNVDYAFRVLPRLVQRVARDVLRGA
jgi:arginine utilization protein RocB